VTDYILENPAKCPNFQRHILEKTLIEPVIEHERAQTRSQTRSSLE
jgi:hypothetical protein